jgi:hypothetical protein
LCQTQGGGQPGDSAADDGNSEVGSQRETSIKRETACLTLSPSSSRLTGALWAHNPRLPTRQINSDAITSVIVAISLIST